MELRQNACCFVQDLHKNERRTRAWEFAFPVFVSNPSVRITLQQMLYCFCSERVGGETKNVPSPACYNSLNLVSLSLCVCVCVCVCVCPSSCPIIVLWDNCVVFVCFSKGQLCDVVLIVGQARVPGHRIVLSAASDYFAAMFTNDVREATQEEIHMKDVDPESLQALVNYMYTGTWTALSLHKAGFFFSPELCDLFSTGR